MNEEFERLINRFSSEWQEQAKEAIILLQKLLKAGKNLDSAVEMLMKEYPALFTLPELQPALVEAACYGYGIVPKVLTAAMFQQWEADLSKAWASDNMKLSKRLHTASLAMRERIVDTVREQMRRNSSWVQTARALFDGYNADKVINEQALPKYITEVRRATQGSVEQLRAARKAINNIERLAKNGAPTKSLKTAYKNLVETALTGSEEQLNKACWVAIQEKSRYVAERIARTELARAYSDGFFRSVADDEDVVAVKWTLNSGHPVFDICDMYQRADLFGLGAGIYPKDKVPPLPAHPFCLCKLFKVYSLKGKPVDHIRQGGDKWLQGLSDVHQNIVLGIQGAKAWRNGEDWRKYMRSWQGVGKADTRLHSIKQEYRPIIRGEEIFKGEYKTRRGVIPYKANKVASRKYEIYASTKVDLKPKLLYEMESQLNDTTKLLKIKNTDNFPKVTILDSSEMGKGWGAYIAVDNMFCFNSDILKLDKMKVLLEMVVKPVSKHRLATAVHEFFHWQDAVRYKAKYGNITNQDDYVEKISEICKKKVEKLVAKGYNIDDISNYADMSKFAGQYDEVYTEYRTKEALKNVKE